MKTLWESLLDTDQDIKKEADVPYFYKYIGQCFTKVFGKLKLPIYTPNGYQNLGTVRNIRGRYNFTSQDNNEFVSRIKKMNKLIKKEFPDLAFDVIDCYSDKILGNRFGWYYTLQWKIDDTSLHGFNWPFTVTEENGVIRTIIVKKPETVEYKEYLNLLTDNL